MHLSSVDLTTVMVFLQVDQTAAADSESWFKKHWIHFWPTSSLWTIQTSQVVWKRFSVPKVKKNINNPHSVFSAPHILNSQQFFSIKAKDFCLPNLFKFYDFYSLYLSCSFFMFCFFFKCFFECIFL